MSQAPPALEIRAIRPEDKTSLAAGMRELSDESRALRFFAYKDRLSGSELRYLTEVDGHDHVALVAIDRAAGEHGIGVARYIRLGPDARMAEAAVAVIDDYQHRGVGARLFRELAAVAVAHDVHWFRCEVLPRNRAMRRLLLGFAPELRVTDTDGILEFDVPLTDDARAELRRGQGEAAARP